MCDALERILWTCYNLFESVPAGKQPLEVTGKVRLESGAVPQLKEAKSL